MKYNINAFHKFFLDWFTKVQFRLRKFTRNYYYFCFEVWLLISQPVEELSKKQDLKFKPIASEDEIHFSFN